MKDATYVPSPRYPTGESLVAQAQWHEERYGPGGWAHEGEENLLRRGQSPWKPERTDAIVAHPMARIPRWACDAAVAYINYCVATYGQWPVTYNPMQAGFSVMVHHVDTEFYDRHYRPGYVTDKIRPHFDNWHR